MYYKDSTGGTRGLTEAAAEAYLLAIAYAEKEGGEEMARYNTFKDIEEAGHGWALPTVVKLIDNGLLRGDGVGFDLSLDMLRLLVIHDRAGIYGDA
jgi:hypothetical protein